MNLVGILIYVLVFFAALLVAAAALVIVFLLFEDFWRRIFGLKKDNSKNSKK